MEKMLLSLFLIGSLLQISLVAQQNAAARVSSVLIKAGRLVDVRAGRVLQNQGILIENDRIKRVGPLADIERQASPATRVVDLSRATVMPGLVDCHVHILLQGDVTSADYDEQLLR